MAETVLLYKTNIDDQCVDFQIKINLCNTMLLVIPMLRGFHAPTNSWDGVGLSATAAADMVWTFMPCPEHISRSLCL